MSSAVASKYIYIIIYNNNIIKILYQILFTFHCYNGVALFLVGEDMQEGEYLTEAEVRV